MSTTTGQMLDGLSEDPTNTSLLNVDSLRSVRDFLDELAANAGHEGAMEHMHGNHQEIQMGHFHTTDEMHAGGHHHHHHQAAGTDHAMQMWFHSGYHEIILFQFWQIDSVIGLLISCLLIFIMACLYEGIKWFRVYLQLAAARCPSSCGKANKQAELAEDKCTDCKSATTPLTNGTTACTRVKRKQTSSTVRLLQAVLYLVQLTLAYWLMLIAMTYNVWLTAAVITGAAFGHWLFAILKCFNPQADELDAFATDACH